MGHSLPLTIFAIVIALTLSKISSAQPPSIVGANDEETQACKDSANQNGNTLLRAIKDRPQSCKILCIFSDSMSRMVNSPDGQLCDDLVGVGPTGSCQNGSCTVGN